MLPTFTMPRPRQMSQVLKWEASPEFSREGRTPLKSGVAVDIGTVLAKVAGKLVILDPAASDGSEEFYGVSLVQRDASTDESEPVLIARRVCRLSASGLLWKDGTTAEQIAAVAADAEAKLVLFGDF